MVKRIRKLLKSLTAHGSLRGLYPPKMQDGKQNMSRKTDRNDSNVSILLCDFRKEGK